MNTTKKAMYLATAAACCVAASAASAECNPRDFIVQDVTSIQQNNDTELAFVLTSTQSEYDNVKRGVAGSGAYGLFAAALSWTDAKERARQIAQSTKFDYKNSYAMNYLNQTISGKALESLSQCYEKDKERPGLALWLKGRDGDYFTFGAFWVGSNGSVAVAKYDTEPTVHGATLISKPDGWLKAKAEDIVVKRDGNNDFYLKLNVGGETRTKVIVKDPPTVVWLKQPVISDRAMSAQTVARNPGCGAAVNSDTIYPRHAGGYFVPNTRTTNHTTNGPEAYSETFKERSDSIEVSISQSTGACEHQKTATGRLQAIEAYPTSIE